MPSYRVIDMGAKYTSAGRPSAVDTYAYRLGQLYAKPNRTRPFSCVGDAGGGR